MTTGEGRAFRASGLDRLFLAIETPWNPMHVGGVMVVDRSGAGGDGPGREEVARLLAARLDRVPTLRYRLVGGRRGLATPRWADPGAVDLDAHVREVRLASPGTSAQLAELTARLMGESLDRGRPLWDVHVVDGLAEGRVALVVRAHHALVDGVAGVRLAEVLLGASTTGPPARLGPPSTGAVARGLAAARRTGAALASLPAAARAAVGPVRAREPRLHGGVREAPFGAPAQPWNGALGRTRQVGLARMSLADVTAARERLGRPTGSTAATVNDVLLAVVAAALRAYLEHRGARVDRPVLAMVPAAVGDGGPCGPNRIAPTFVALPVDEPDPLVRLGRVAARMDRAKRRLARNDPATAARLADVAPTPVVAAGARLYGGLRLADRHRPVWNVAVSNVRGPGHPLAVAGAAVEAIYPLGVVHEMCGLVVTLMTYGDEVFAGLAADRRLVPDVAVIADALPPALAELRSAPTGSGA